MADKGGFNPYAYRNVDNPLSNCEAFFSLFKSIVGVGILALPLAFYYAGVILGIVLICLMALVLMHAIHVLIGCMVECSRRQGMGYCPYPDSLRYAFSLGPEYFRKVSQISAYVVDAMLCFLYYGICVVYIVFVAAHFKQIFDVHVIVLDIRVFVLVIGVLCVPIFMIRSLKALVPINCAAVLLLYLAIFCMLFYIFEDTRPPWDMATLYGEIQMLPFFLGIIMFSVTSVGAILAVESKMRNPEKFLGWVGMLGRTTIAVLICYVFFGILGYWKYVVEVEGAVSLNLPTNEIVSNAIKVLFALAIFLSYPLTGYVFIQIIMTRYWNKNNDLKHPHCMEYLLRCIFLLITTSNALLFPNLIPMMTLVGSFSISILNLIGPALLDFCLCYSNGDYGKMRWKLLRALAFIILGIVLLLVGVIYAFMDMIDDFGGAGGLTTDEPPISSPEPDTTLAEAAGGEAAPEAEGFLRFLRGNPIFKP